MVSLGILDSYELLWSTCFHRVNTTTTWYNLKREGWDFRWNELINEVDQASIELPVTLRDPDDFPILADEIDIFILKELEKDATISLSDLAKMLGTSIQNVHYHFKKHIEGRFLIEDYQIVFKKFDLETSVFPRFIIEFPNHQYLAKTANVFRNKPFTEVLGKILDTNKLLVAAYLPLKEFFNMLRTLNRMVALGIIKSYNYRIVYPLEKSERQTIPYKNFQKGSWIFEADKYIERLHELHRKLGTTAG
jgi:DNA-binding Lrp family transcriptional regulator